MKKKYPVEANQEPGTNLHVASVPVHCRQLTQVNQDGTTGLK